MKLGNIESIELTKLPIEVSEILDDYVSVKYGLELERIIHPILRGIVYRIKAHILAEEIDNRTKDISFTYSTPKNWWEHLKLSLPQWLKNILHPPKMIEYTKTKTVTFRKYATFPKANILFPDEVGKLIKYKSFIEEV